MNLKKGISTRLGMTALVIGTVSAAVFGIAVLTSIPDSAGVIHGCYGKTNGNVRIVESASKCSSTETPIAWNQTGQPGAQGIPGIQGPTGPQGPAGSSGGLAGYEVIQGNLALFTTDETGNRIGLSGASCPSGKVAVGGGFASVDPAVVAYASFPFGAQTWTAALRQTNNAAPNPQAWAYAVCVSVQ